MTRFEKTVKKGLECCAAGKCVKSECPYYGAADDLDPEICCNTALARDALKFIKVLELELLKKQGNAIDADALSRTILEEVPLKYFYGRTLDVASRNMAHIRWVIEHFPMIEATRMDDEDTVKDINVPTKPSKEDET